MVYKNENHTLPLEFLVRQQHPQEQKPPENATNNLDQFLDWDNKAGTCAGKWFLPFEKVQEKR